MVHRDDNGQYITVQCDTCGKDAPSAGEILRGHGLMHGFGWYCSGGVHICADCPHPVVTERPLRDATPAA